MEPITLRKGLYWTGVLDPGLRVFDIIMNTEFGTTYNSYVLQGSEKTALFETAKAKFRDGYLETVAKLVDLKTVDYIIVSHTEPDHSGTIETILDRNPNIKLVGTACAIGYLQHIVNRDFYSIVVKEGDTLSLGDITLRFFPLPNLHWPDTMFTYIEEMQALVTCDAFGAHYSFDGVLRSKLQDTVGYLRAAKYYFDNIIGPFKRPFMTNALAKIQDLPIELILTGHGPVLDSYIPEIVTLYQDWCADRNPNTKKTVVIPYVSAYGYTRELSEQIERGIRDSGDVEVRRYDMVENDPATVLSEIDYADGVLFGTPTIVGEALKPIWDLTTSMFAPVHRGKLASAFGSYGWSGEGVPNITERLKQLRMKVLDGYRIRFKPDENQLIGAYEFGYNFGCVLQNKENDKRKPATKRMVKCLICGAIFEEGTERCPVCGVGSEQFVSIEENDQVFHKDTEKRFLILGGGVAALNAAHEIRKRDRTAAITMLFEEDGLPYNRPMLTKRMFAGLTNAQIAVHDAAWYSENKITMRSNVKVAALDPQQKMVTLESGEALPYDTCIYALGARSFVPPFAGTDLPEVVSIRTLSDVEKLAALLGDSAKKAVVIGGGVLGLETAWELKKAKCEVTVIDTVPRLLADKIAPHASKMLSDIAAEKGVALMLDACTEAIVNAAGHVAGVRLKDGTTVPADLVVVSTGVRANLDVAKAAGLVVDRAIVVDDHMRTNLTDVYACGDCAIYNSVSYCLWSEAAAMGTVAGANAAGDDVVYEQALPAVTMNVMETALYAVGDNGANAGTPYKTVEFRDKRKHEIEAYFFQNGRLVGATLLGDLSKVASVLKNVTEKAVFKDLF